MSTQKFTIEIEQEQDQRWIAEVLELPGVMVYGSSPDDAKAKVQALALRVLADRLEHGESVPELLHITFEAACNGGRAHVHGGCSPLWSALAGRSSVNRAPTVRS